MNFLEELLGGVYDGLKTVGNDALKFASDLSEFERSKFEGEKIAEAYRIQNAPAQQVATKSNNDKIVWFGGIALAGLAFWALVK